MYSDDNRVVVSKKVDGEEALLIREDKEYRTYPEGLGFEGFLARGISKDDEDFVLKGVYTDGVFVATDVYYHGESLVDRPWCERFLALKKQFDFKPSVLRNGAIVVEEEGDLVDVFKAFESSPYFDGVYVFDYDSEVGDKIYYIDDSAVGVL